MNDELILGTEATFLLTINKIGNYSAKDFGFDVELYTNPKKKVRLNKYDCIPDTDGSDGKFYVMIDTSELGVGEITADIIPYIPDTRYDDGLRTEIVRIETGVTIIP